jgi:hypothetical protein
MSIWNRSSRTLSHNVFYLVANEIILISRSSTAHLIVSTCVCVCVYTQVRPKVKGKTGVAK